MRRGIIKRLPLKKRTPRKVTAMVAALEIFRCFPDAEIAKLLGLKQCSASTLVHNRKPKKVKA